MREKLKYLIPGYGYYLIFCRGLHDLSGPLAALFIVYQVIVVWTPITLLVCQLAGN